MSQSKQSHTVARPLTTTWLFLTAASAWGATPLGTAWTYQGRLEQNGSPVNGTCDCQFSLWDDPVDGVKVGPTLTFDGGNAIAVVDGVFSVELDFGAGAFNGDRRWLEISVACPSGSALTPLSPRRPVSPAPVALALRGMQTPESGDAAFAESWNVVGGHAENSVSAGVGGATVAGGGRAGFPNSVTANFGAVIGGVSNTASGSGAAVTGGSSNVASGSSAIVAGGSGNLAQGDDSFAAGSMAGALHDHAFVWNGDICDFCSPFNSSGPGQFLIRAAGGVGIGTTSPSNALSVQGSADFSGSVGVGTSSPQADLHVRPGPGATLGQMLVTPGTSDSSSQITMTENTSATLGSIMRYDGTANQWQVLGLSTGGTEVGPHLVVRRDDGRVGIGTTAPDRALHIADGDAGVTSNSNSRLVVERAGSTFINILTPETFQSGILFGNPADGSAAGGVVYNSSNSPDGMQFRVNGNSVKMTIAGDGNVGIGTTAPQAKLHVAGDVLISGEIQTPTQTHHRIIPPTAFVPGDQVIISATGVSPANGSVSGARAWAQLPLPDGATITAVSARITVNTGTGAGIQLDLMRHDFDGGRAQLDGLSTATPGDSLLEFEPTSGITLDLENHAYYLQCIFGGTGVNRALREVDILYTTQTIE